MLYLNFDDKECALTITLYLMKFNLMQSMICEWMHFFLLYRFIVEYVLLVLNDIERGKNTYTSRILSI